MTTQGVEARKTLGQLIKRERERHRVNGRKLTQTALGERLDWSQGKVQKMEDASVRIHPADVDLIIKELDIEWATAEEMRRLAALNVPLTPGDDERTGSPHYVRQLMHDEQDAREILSWHELRIPGPLQSEHYMLTQFNTTGTTDVTTYIRTRMQRKRLFDRPHLQCYQCVLAEEALHRAATGLGPEIARDQIEEILALNERHAPGAPAQISVRILPVRAPVPYLPGDFALLHFADRKSYVYSECVGSARYIKSAQAIERARADHWTLSQAALGPTGTKELLEELHHRFGGP